MIPYILAAVGGYLIGQSQKKELRKFEDGGIMVNDDLRKAIYDMDEDEYENFCAEYELDSDDSNEVENFVYDAKMSEAKKMIEDIKSGKYNKDEKFSDGGMIDKKIEGLESALANPDLSSDTKSTIKMKLKELKKIKEGK